MPRPLHLRERDPVPTVQEAGWVPGPARAGAERLGLIGARFPDLPAQSESLYRLSYPGTRACKQYTYTLILLRSNTKRSHFVNFNNVQYTHHIHTLLNDFL